VEKFVAEEVPGFQVWRAKCHKGHSYTVKRFSLTEFDPRRMLVNEMDGLIDCPEHQAITPLDAFLERLEIVLVLDNMDGKYLREVVEKKGKLPEQNASIVLRQVLQAVRYLHESKLRVHNDIDARNVLVLKSGEVRLGGFCYSTRNVGASQKFAGEESLVLSLSPWCCPAGLLVMISSPNAALDGDDAFRGLNDSSRRALCAHVA